MEYCEIYSINNSASSNFSLLFRDEFLEISIKGFSYVSYLKAYTNYGDYPTDYWRYNCNIVYVCSYICCNANEK